MAKIKKKKIELLAPVGSFESLHAAIEAGADAIYFGVEQLNMRARSAGEFLTSDIQKIKSTCKKREVKAYLTLNTVMYDHDMQLLASILKEAKKQKVDAVIASDFAVMESCRQMGIPVHVSTQASVSNLKTVEFFSAFSDVIVLARELTLKQVAQITREIRRKKIRGVSGELLKIEVFAHGALCMAVSGKCYLSLHAQNASANRGACIQNCRRPYLVTDMETGQALQVENPYIMSPKDLSTIDVLDQVIQSGIDVIKIEGRTKGPEYTYTVTRCYREAIDAIRDQTYTAEKIEVWKKELGKVYNRGFWEGYYLGRKLGEWTPQPGSVATTKKIYVGKAVKYYPRIRVAEFLVESSPVKKGDTLLVTGPAFGPRNHQALTLRVNGEEAHLASKGDRITFPVTEKISGKEKLYKIIDTSNAQDHPVQE